MGRNQYRARDSLRGSDRGGKTLRNGFGMVRLLTSASQQSMWRDIDRMQLSGSEFRRATPPLHVTLVGFVGMSQREQRAFEAGFDVARLEQKLGNEVPRPTLRVELGRVANFHSLIYVEVEDERVRREQAQLVGSVAMRGIEPERIKKQVVSPHVTLGYAPDAELVPDLVVQFDEALSSQSVTLEAWRVYSGRYA